MDLENKVALVTGALGGIGLEYVKVLLKNKVKVALVDINKDLGRSIIGELTKEYGVDRHIYIQADVTNQNQLKDAFQKTVDTFKNLDIVVNNAGIINEINPIKSVDVNLSGVIIGSTLAFEEFLPKYKSGDEGVVVNTASLAGLAPFFGAPAYSATKFAIVGYGRSLGHPQHYEKTKVRIVTLCPGFTDTALINRENVLSVVPDRLAPMVLYTVDMLPIQNVEDVGKMFYKALTEGRTGSVWLINDGKGGEVEFPIYTVKA